MLDFSHMNKASLIRCVDNIATLNTLGNNSLWITIVLSGCSLSRPKGSMDDISRSSYCDE